MYHELLYHLDLCILSYHTYTQTLIWPFDPYYEHMSATGTSRRDAFMERLRSTAFNTVAPHNNNPARLYHGPGNSHGWRHNNWLDPIIHRYDRISPWDPAFCSPEPGSWLYYKIPDAITRPIAQVHMVRYQPGGADPNDGNGPTQVVQVSNNPGGAGTDHLYCFEGGLGRINDTPSAWSPMGCVLDRQVAGGYEVHIVFRGSRSGSSGRAAAHGLREKGNPDWVTDMDARQQVQDNDFSRKGKICRGFSRAVKTSMPTLLAALSSIQARRGGAPAHIYVTGHSLGGALAATFASAMAVGNKWGPNGGGNAVPAPLRPWPWRHMKLITFSCPAVGDYHLQEEFNAKIHGRRVWLGEDPVTTENFGYHVGAPIWISNGSSNALYYSKRVAGQVPVLGSVVGAIGAAATTWHHEPMHIRDCLYRDANAWGDDLANVVGNAMSHADFPWKVYPSFRDLVSANERALTRPVLQRILNGFTTDLERYMTAFAEVMSTSAAYKSFFVYTSSQNTRRQAVLDAAQALGGTRNLMPFEVAQRLATSSKNLVKTFDGFGKHVAFATLLAEYLGNASDRADRGFPLTGLLAQEDLRPYLI